MTRDEAIARKKPDKAHNYKEHTLDCCPDCQTPVKDPIQSYQRYTEDIPPVEPEVTEHTVYGYWCSKCQKIVYPKVTDVLPNAMIGLRVVVFTAWLHYLIGVSVNNIVRMLSVFTSFSVTAGGLTQAWKNLASTMESIYNDIGQRVTTSAVLTADETGWRINGVTHWLWRFATQTFCYYVIDKSRGSPVVKKVFGAIFKGILISDFWGAYNKLCALAKRLSACPHRQRGVSIICSQNSLKWTNATPLLTGKHFVRNYPVCSRMPSGYQTR